MSDQHEPQATAPPEGEFYVEPTRMSPRDTWGVAAALVALALIGAGGYIWLNPELSMASLLRREPPRQPAPATDQPAAAGHVHALDSAGSSSAAPPAASPAAGSPAVADAAEPDAATAPPSASAARSAEPADMSCPVCGMYSDRSLAHSVAHWSDGTATHHDCWQCLFSWGRGHKLSLMRAEVLRHGSSNSAPVWLDASPAHFLYGTADIKGSMPPYAAAFSDQASAEAEQPLLGGEIVDWAGLQAKFSH